MHVGKRVELVYDPIRITSHDHAQLGNVIDEQVLPKLGAGCGQVVFLFENHAHRLGEGFVIEDMAEHVPGIRSADGDFVYDVMSPDLHAPLLGISLGIDGGIICLVHVGLEDVFGEVVI